MSFHVISLRGPYTRLGLLVMGLILAVWLVNPRVSVAKSPPLAVYRVETPQRLMALTINVVWGDEYVPRLLQELKAEKVVATFMLGGAWARTHPALVRTMQRDGDELGNHGWNHRHPTQLSFAANVEDIEKTNRVIADIAGTTPRVYAPPYGEFNRTVLRAAEAAHTTLIMWTIDTIDWRPSSSVAYMISKVLRHAQPGAIVLMHPTDRTVEALIPVIHGLKQRGYHLVTVSRLLASGTPRGDS